MSKDLKQLFTLKDKETFIQKALTWSEEFTYSSYFEPNEFNYPFEPFRHMLGVANDDAFTIESTFDDDLFFKRLKLEHKRKWLFGFLSYDLKNQIEHLSSQNPTLISFPNALFFEPTIRLEYQGNLLKIEGENPEEIFLKINETEPNTIKKEVHITIESKTNENIYFAHIDQIRNWIKSGEVYELNYCLAHVFNSNSHSPRQLFSILNEISPNPFGGFMVAREFGLAIASPERFLKKSGNLLISQPIKGTMARNLEDEKLDKKLAELLRTSEKELAENLMIVDLVRNDLSKSCEAGSVNVHELFGVYSFTQVHQLISTVVGTKRLEVHFTECISNAFPMGSMTGAPKIRAMELIDQIENFKRGPFSGAFGYITPDGDFDFNVLIRSVFVNHKTKEGLFAAGSAITFDSIADQEWDECNLKTKAIRKMLQTSPQ